MTQRSENLTHEQVLEAIRGCAATVTALSYEEAIGAYFKLRGLGDPATNSEVEGLTTGMVEKLDAAILGLNPLTGYGEDAVWRPADRARSVLIQAREEIERMAGWLLALEPHLDAVICYASDMNGHPPNRAVKELRAALSQPPADEPAKGGEG